MVSGLENRSYIDNKNKASDLLEEDQGTLGSQGANTNARESNIVNYDTNEGSAQPRLRSTMYITGKNQRFAIKQGHKKTSVTKSNNKSPSPRNNPNIGKTMIINLGERTQTNFGNRIDEDINMVVGVTDIATGASHVQHPSNKNFKPKIRPKQMYRGQSGSLS